MKALFKSFGQRFQRPGKLFQYAFLALATLVLICCTFTAWIFWGLPDISQLEDSSATLTIEVPNWQGQMHPFLVGPKNPYWTPLDSMPAELKWAVIVAEDANFYEHRGIDVPALKEALKHDLKSKRLERGASTITQQLAKNLFLSRDKSLRRKLRELVLARHIEQVLTKGRILELYLNVVELGPLVYGTGHGARYHFGRPVSTLTPAESAFLAAMLPGPRIAFNPETKTAKVRQRAARLLKLLGLRHILSETELADALVQLGQIGGPRTTRLEPTSPAETDRN